MMIQLENEQIKASVLALGAELRSLVDKKSGKEWMWQADPAFWGKTSPILFPIVGALKGNAYQYEGKSYNLPRHGFAREMNFDVRKQEGDSAVFGLSSTEETRSLFPFDFDLEVEYILVGAALRVEYRVKNSSVYKPMWFSLGAHPAFAIEVNEDKVYSDYQLWLEQDEVLNIHPLQGNQLLRKTEVVPLENGVLPLSYPLFYNDALVMTDMKSQRIVLQNSKDDQKLTFSFSNFPHFGIWAVKDADFVCLEPWSGVADFEDHDGELTRKFGINQLGPGESWTAEWKVEID
ncbi:aldose 1-epimerase family protein [Parabacteroides sp. FAFU027]|uniref:aldose 1-epimerase family protein n=1 Tax=Parabacteroides sp. FAFU027 TaxID=2922715 RepID=UPI001FAF2624|nr:aldose 1-epimerase family protein [Parabacteroides sp. FAFU027]